MVLFVLSGTYPMQLPLQIADQEWRILPRHVPFMPEVYASVEESAALVMRHLRLYMQHVPESLRHRS